MFFVDDLKIYAEGLEELGEALQQLVSGLDDVGMCLGLQKCGIAHMVKGRADLQGNSMVMGTGEIKEVSSDSTGITKLSREIH